MSGRLAGLAALSVCELLAALTLRNEALALRAEVELQRRRQERHLELILEYRARLASYLAPEAVARRAAWRAQRELERLPEL